MQGDLVCLVRCEAPLAPVGVGGRRQVGSGSWRLVENKAWAGETPVGTQLEAEATEGRTEAGDA